MPTYHQDLKARNILKLRELLTELPAFLGEYFRAMSDQTSARTRIGYAYDLKIFFHYLSDVSRSFTQKPVTEFTTDDLARVTSEDIEEFMDYLSYYIKIEEREPDEQGRRDLESARGSSADSSAGSAKRNFRKEPDGVAMQNEALGKSRKLAAVRTMFKYFYRKKKISANPAELVGFPKLHEKPITTLEADEVVKLLDEVDSGEHLNERRKIFHELTKTRDAAIVTLLLGTGMRVSECVGIDINHIDFKVNGVKVTRKGGDEVILYFGDEVEAALK
ncbi:MAG: tyrosine-type recombinase/integrase, partial [Clostridiales bacterium]|nr:tyrosine-type recombinase/integrase [Clostridiales bacterium]